MTVKHAKQSGLPADAGNSNEVEPTDWYADHVITGLTGGLAVVANPGAKGTFPAALTSNTYADIDATYLKATVTGTGPFFVFANFLCASVSGGERLYVTIAVDGTNIFGASGLVVTSLGGSFFPISIAGASTGTLSAGSHTIAIQGKTFNGATITFDVNTSFIVLGSDVGLVGAVDYDASPNPTAYDQEFKGALDGWTTLGSLDTSNANTDLVSHAHLSKTTSGFQVDGIYRAVPSIPFTMTIKLGDSRSFEAGREAGLFLGEATPGKLWTLGTAYDADFDSGTWASRTSRSAFASGGNIGETVDYLRVVVNSSTNVDAYISRNGLVWTQVLTGVNPLGGSTIGSFGLWVTAFAASPSEAYFDWIRFGTDVVRPTSTLWQNVGGSSNRSWPLDWYSIDATYGDDFTAGSLSTSWTRRNFTSGAETYQVGPERTYMRVAFNGRATGDGYFRTAPAGDWTFATAFIPRFYDATGPKLFGIAVVDTSGTGVWFSSGNGSPAAFDLLQLTTYTTYGGSYVEAGYNGAAPNVSYIADVMPYQRKIWLSLRKSGTNYYAAFSVDGEVWGVESSALAWAGTVDRVGLIYGPLSSGTLTNGYIDIDWFNKIA